MGESTKIGWCHHTFNPWWGCTKVSPGCTNCYADSFSRRLGHGKSLPTIWGAKAERKLFAPKHWAEPLTWNRRAKEDGVRRRVFCASMADVFEDRPDLVDERARLFRLIEATTRLDWLLLTKRPENVQRLAAECTWFNTWPENVWLGVTAEDQKHANERIPLLLGVRGPEIRFVSYEPALEAVDFAPYLEEQGYESNGPAGWVQTAPAVDWVIVGGESGPGARSFDVRWAERVVEQCAAARVACFVKQLGSRPVLDIEPTGNFRTHEGRRQLEMRATSLRLQHRKGEDPAEWPPELRVREFPPPLHADDALGTLPLGADT